MCIAIYKPKDITINKTNLEQSFKANPHGAGFSYIENKTLKTKKGFFTFEEFWEAFEPHQEKQCLIHFRIRTHGLTNKENCHPFQIKPGLAFIHNGIISGLGSGDQSDTSEFNDKILKALASRYGVNALYHPTIKHLIEERIGYSKFVLMDRHGNHSIFNEHKGAWDEGVWYSNTSYKIVKPLPKITTVKNYNSSFPTKWELQRKRFAALNDTSNGDLLMLDIAQWDSGTQTLTPKDTILEVVAINHSDYSVDCMTQDGTDFLYAVPILATTNLMGMPTSDDTEEEEDFIADTYKFYNNKWTKQLN